MTEKTALHWMRVEGAAEYTAIAASTLNKLRLTGGGPVYSKVGKIVVYERSDLDAWMSSKRRKTTSAAAGGQ